MLRYTGYWFGEVTYDDGLDHICVYTSRLPSQSEAMLAGLDLARTMILDGYKVVEVCTCKEWYEK